MPVKALCLFAALFISTTAAARDGHTDLPHARLLAEHVLFAGSAQWDNPPELSSGRLPYYPISQLLARRKGSATLRYVIDADGVPGDIVVEEASDPRFADHAVIAVRAWRFQPATKGTGPAQVVVRETFYSEPGARYGSVTVFPPSDAVEAASN